MPCKLGFHNLRKKGGKIKVKGDKEFAENLLYLEQIRQIDEDVYFPLIAIEMKKPVPTTMKSGVVFTKEIDLVDYAENTGEYPEMEELRKLGLSGFDCMGYDTEANGELDTVFSCKGCKYFQPWGQYLKRKLGI